MPFTRFALSLFASLATSVTASAQQVIPLWEQGAPGFESRRDEPEQHKDWWFKNIHNPSLTVFLPPAGKANGTAVVIAPGGGHRELVFNPEGVEPAQYLASLGVTAFALKYRLHNEPGSPYKREHTAQDIRRAMRLVRARAGEWHIDPTRVGVMGWSAGGDVAGMVAYLPEAGDSAAADPIERLSARPDFEILIYPGGLVPKEIPRSAPPLFLLGAADDQYVSDTLFELTRLYREAGVSLEAHLYAAGKHGFNMGQRSQFVSIRRWPDRLGEWLEDRGLLTAKAK